MQNIVDVVGIEGVIKMITANSKLTKFIIFRQGASSGSTPVYDCTYTSSNHLAANAFKAWAQNILTANPYNNIAYDMLLFKDKEDGDISEEEDEKKAARIGKSKTGKVRFSFCLTNFNSYMPQHHQVPQVDVAAEIAKALEIHSLKTELAALKAARIAEDDEDDEEESGSTLEKAITLVREINKNKKLDRLSDLQVAGDDDDDEEEEEAEIDDDDDTGISDDDEDEKPAATKNKKKMTEEQLIRIKKALRMLSKHTKSLDKDLMLLAKFADKNPSLFKNYMNTMRNAVG